MKRLAAGLALLLAAQAWAEQPGSAVLVKEETLRAAPRSDSQALATLPTHSNVLVQGRQGGWYRVTAKPKQDGWLRLFALRFQSAATVPGSSGVGSLVSAVRTGHSDVTATTGVRGLTQQDLNQARADFNALRTMTSYRVDAGSARAFAAEGKLRPRELAYAEARR